MFVSKQKYNDLEAKCQKLSDTLSNSNDRIKELESELEKARKESLISDRNQVTLYISDDMETVEPFIKFKETANDVLLKAGYATGTDDYQTQIGLMVVASEAINQIIGAFTEDVKDE